MNSTGCQLTIAIVIPLLNAETTIIKTLESLVGQTQSFNELIIVDDGSTDNSLNLVNDFYKTRGDVFKERRILFRVLKHSTSQGLSASYNDGIRHSVAQLIVTVHSDVVMKSNEDLKKLIEPFCEDHASHIVATYHSVIHPYPIWQKYNFWQKCFFSRLVRKKFYGLDGKFDCFRRNVLEEIGLFDSVNFFRAGEDGDIICKLKKRGRLVKTEAEIIHLHSMDPNFNIKSLIYKQAQYSEAQGALLRRYGFSKIGEFLRVFFRELLILSLFVPYVRLLSISLVIFYSFLYNKEVYLSEWRDKRIVLLPFLNIFLLFVSMFFSLKGFITGKQKI